MLVISFVLSVLIGYLFRSVLIDSMSNVKVAQEAQEYLKRDSINLTTEIDTYLYTNITVVPKGENDDDLDSYPGGDDDDDDDDDDNDSDNDSDGGSDGGDGGD